MGRRNWVELSLRRELRVEMLNMEEELNGEFQQQLDTDLPGEIVDIVTEGDAS